MSTHLVWSKMGLKLVCETEKRPVPRTGYAFPLPDFGTVASPLVSAAMEFINTTGFRGIRVTSLGEGLPGFPGDGRVWKLNRTAYIGSRPTVPVWESVILEPPSVSFLLEQPLLGATHEFYVSATDSVGGTPREQNYPSITIAVPATLEDSLFAGTQIIEMQNDWAKAQANHTQMNALAVVVFANEGYAAGVATQAGTFEAAFQALNSISSTWADSTISVDISALSPDLWTRWKNWNLAVDNLDNLIAEELNNFYDRVADDGWLSRGEKPRVIVDWQTAQANKATIAARATALQVDATVFNAAYSALDAYLHVLAPAFDDVTTDTAITAADWKAAWSNYNTAKEDLLLRLQSATVPIVKGVSTGNIANLTTNASLSSVLDGITPATDDKFLVVAQTTKSQNGLYSAVVTPGGGVAATDLFPSTYSESGTGTITNPSNAYDNDADSAFINPTSLTGGAYIVTFKGFPSNAATGGTLYVEFNQDCFPEGESFGLVEVSPDAGGSWTTLSNSGTSGAYSPTFSLTNVDLSKVWVRFTTHKTRIKTWDPDAGVYIYDIIYTSFDVSKIRIHTNGTGGAANYALTKIGEIFDKSQWRISSGTVNGNKVKVASVASDNTVTLTDAPDLALPTATPTVLGGVKVGNGLAIDGAGVLSSSAAVSLDPTGFVNPDLVVVTYDPTTRKVTLSGTVVAYYHGDSYPTLVNGWVSPAHSATDGPWYLKVNGSGIVWEQTPWAFSDLMIAYVHYEVATAANRFGIRECHGLMPWQSHQGQHETMGTYRQSGGALSGYALNDSTTAANRRPAVAATVVQDEDLVTTIPALADNGPYTLVNINGSGVTTFTTSAADIVPLSTNNPYYNPITAGNGAQTLMPNNRYMSVWLVAVPATADSGSQLFRYLWIQGQSAGSRATEASKSFADLALGQLRALFTEFVPIGRLILRYTASNWTIDTVEALTGTRVLAGTSVASAPQQRSDIAAFCSGKPTNAAVIAGVAATYEFRVESSNHQSKALAAATGSSVFTVKKNGTSIGTATFAAAGSVATWSITQTDFAIGDYLTITAPGTADATLADIALTVSAVRL